MMVGKVIGTGNGFRGVVNYLLLGKKDDPNPDRVSWVGFRNLLTEDPEDVPALMRATANQSTRCKSPVYHYAISWHRDHSPSDDLMRDIADATLKDMGLDEHQVFLMAHDDTAHRHIHIIANRVHPETIKAWSNSQDYRRLEISLRKQAEARGLPYVPGKFNDPEKFGGKGRRPRDGEYQAAVRHGKAPPKSMWGRDDIKGLRSLLAPTFTEASSWDDLNARVAAFGFRITAKGQGLIIEGADGFMKLSDLGKQVRVKTLEDTFGESFADYASRRAGLPDDALKPGAGLITPTSINLKNPGQSPRSQTGENALQSTEGATNGDEDAFTDTARDEARRAWSARRIALTHKIKPGDGSSDEGAPVDGIPHPDADPKTVAYHTVREARAQLSKLKRDALRGQADIAQLADAQLRLDNARRDLDALLNAEREAARGASTRPDPVPTRIEPPARPTHEPTPQASPSVASFKDKPGQQRSDAFAGLRAARQAHDLAEALFNAGVISADELKAASEDVKRAAENLRPHLTLEEQLKNDIADALWPKPRKPTPKKGGPSR